MENPSINGVHSSEMFWQGLLISRVYLVYWLVASGIPRVESGDMSIITTGLKWGDVLRM